MRSSILPTTSSDAIQTIVPRRYLKVAIYLLCLFGVLATISFFSGVAWDDVQATRDLPPFTQRPPVSLTDFPNYPPGYARWHKIEEALAQHNQHLAFPEGKEGRYVYFSEHVKSTFVLIPIPNSAFRKAQRLPSLCYNSGGVGERTPGAFFPRAASLPGAEIVRGRSLNPYLQPALLIIRMTADMHLIASQARVTHRHSETREGTSFPSTSQ